MPVAQKPHTITLTVAVFVSAEAVAKKPNAMMKVGR
jgi:hypothetical protein